LKGVVGGQVAVVVDVVVVVVVVVVVGTSGKRYLQSNQQGVAVHG
jgi:hypothetical protein